MEIDEYRDYEKALGALNEAWKQLAKAGPQAEKLAQLKQKIFLVERYALFPMHGSGMMVGVNDMKIPSSGSTSDRGHSRPSGDLAASREPSLNPRMSDHPSVSLR